jgi:hypothetical protein
MSPFPPVEILCAQVYKLFLVFREEKNKLCANVQLGEILKHITDVMFRLSEQEIPFLMR